MNADHLLSHFTIHHWFPYSTSFINGSIYLLFALICLKPLCNSHIELHYSDNWLCKWKSAQAYQWKLPLLCHRLLSFQHKFNIFICHPGKWNMEAQITLVSTSSCCTININSPCIELEMEIPLTNVCEGVNLVYNILIFGVSAGREEDPFWFSDPMLASGG